MMKLTCTVYDRCFSILICGMLMVGSSQTFVLCMGEDGHVAVKGANSACCGKLRAGGSRDNSEFSGKEGFSSSENSCGSCADIPFSTGFATVIKKPNRVNPVLPTSTTIALLTVKSPDFSEYHSVSEPFVPTHYFTPLRSIILLI